MFGVDDLRENIDYVAYTPRNESSWTFVIKGNCRKLSQITDELLMIIGKLYEYNSNFFIPTKIDFSIQTFTIDGPVNRYFSDKSGSLGRLGAVRKEIQSEGGISFTTFSNDINCIETQKNVIKYFGRVQITQGKTKFVLKNNEIYIDNNSKELYFMEDFSTHRIIRPSVDPISIDVTHSMLKGPCTKVDVDDPAYYKIVFWTLTDIWFEDNSIGMINRERLKAVFQKIFDNFEVVDTLFTGSAENLFR